MAKSYKSFNWFRRPPKGEEYNSGISMTVPDMALSMKQIIQRHANGRSLPYFPAWFDGDIEGLPDFKMMTEVDKLRWAADTRRSLEGRLERKPRESFESYLERFNQFTKKLRVEKEMSETPPPVPSEGT